MFLAVNRPLPGSVSSGGCFFTSCCLVFKRPNLLLPWGQIRSHQPPFVTRSLDWQAGQSSACRFHPTLGPLAPAGLGAFSSALSLAWPLASPEILVNGGVLLRPLEGLTGLGRGASCCLSLLRGAPRPSAAEGPLRDNITGAGLPERRWGESRHPEPPSLQPRPQALSGSGDPRALHDGEEGVGTGCPRGPQGMWPLRAVRCRG